jgi:hypothetical protein
MGRLEERMTEGQTDKKDNKTYREKERNVVRHIERKTGRWERQKDLKTYRAKGRKMGRHIERKIEKA